jgi:UDP-N-acetylmuramoyl-tripeptide--D-alanyl-D-alanine ligase
VDLPMSGPHQIDNFLAAAAIGIAVGVSASDCAAAAADLHPASHRGELQRHSSGALLYDDAYNANPSSVRAALETLPLLPGTRRIAVLGDMLELGADEERWHREAGSAVVGRADVLICVGPRACWFGEGAVEAGFPTGSVHCVASAEEAAQMLRGLITAGDAVLFKASRGIGLDRAVAMLSGGV